ncbi:MAG: sugar transferase [Acidobacteria bacterium]|nr:sugar transferase [Acidobacteriota bacterium]
MLGDPRIGVAADDSYAPFQPRVAFSYSSVAAATEPASFQIEGIARSEVLPCAVDAPSVEFKPLDPKTGPELSDAVPLSEYQWSGPGRPEPYRRLLDIAVSLTLLIALGPLLLLAAAILRMRMGAEPLVTERRIGRFGKEIDLISFRTKMRGNPEGARFGRMLRRAGVSSLPMLLNVLRGDLSLVGPRPVSEHELPRYGLDVIYYLAARPGFTGAWRINRAAHAGQAGRDRADREYVRARTFTADLKFMLATLPATLIRKRAV